MFTSLFLDGGTALMRYSDSSQITIRLGVVAVFFESYLLILIADWPPLRIQTNDAFLG